MILATSFKENFSLALVVTMKFAGRLAPRPKEKQGGDIDHHDGDATVEVIDQ